MRRVRRPIYLSGATNTKLCWTDRQLLRPLDDRIPILFSFVYPHSTWPVPTHGSRAFSNVPPKQGKLPPLHPSPSSVDRSPRHGANADPVTSVAPPRPVTPAAGITGIDTTVLHPILPCHHYSAPHSDPRKRQAAGARRHASTANPRSPGNRAT